MTFQIRLWAGHWETVLVIQTDGRGGYAMNDPDQVQGGAVLAACRATEVWARLCQLTGIVHHQMASA